MKTISIQIVTTILITSLLFAVFQMTASHISGDANQSSLLSAIRIFPVHAVIAFIFDAIPAVFLYLVLKYASKRIKVIESSRLAYSAIGCIVYTILGFLIGVSHFQGDAFASDFIIKYIAIHFTLVGSAVGLFTAFLIYPLMKEISNQTSLTTPVATPPAS